MITFDILTLKAFLQEEISFLTGARINKIKQPTRREFLFTLRNNGISRDLYVNITPQMYHICFPNSKNIKKRHFEIPQKPPMFCMQLRKHLENSRISKVCQPENERILEFYIETYNEIGDKIYLCLAFELMGKHSNIVLYNCDTGIILGCAHNVGTEKSREREIYGGIPYIYPPKQIKNDINNFNGEINYESLSNDFYGFSSAFAKQCQNQPLERLKNFIALKNLAPALSQDFKTFCLYSELIENPKTFATVNEMIDEYYANFIEKEKFNAKKSTFTTIITQKIKKIQKSLSVMQNQINSRKTYDQYRLYGDLIMANLYKLKDYVQSAQVFDYENNLEITIELDPQKTLKENANSFYKLYTKGKNSNEKLTELINKSVIKKEYFEQVLYSIESAKTLPELEDIAPEVEENSPTRQKTKIQPEIATVELENGEKIYIGKNNKQNDYIISKIASDEDLWFHVHNCAGSHVLLKSKIQTDELILKCAKLAKEYSTAKEASKTGIIYTKRKYLRKPPGAALGYVTYRNEKEIII